MKRGEFQIKNSDKDGLLYVTFIAANGEKINLSEGLANLPAAKGNIAVSIMDASAAKVTRVFPSGSKREVDITKALASRRKQLKRKFRGVDGKYYWVVRNEGDKPVIGCYNKSTDEFDSIELGFIGVYTAHIIFPEPIEFRG